MYPGHGNVDNCWLVLMTSIIFLAVLSALDGFQFASGNEFQFYSLLRVHKCGRTNSN